MNWTLHEGEALALLQAQPDASVDAVITDPPYSSGGQFRGDRTAAPSLKYQQTSTITKRPDFGGDNRDQHAYAYWCALWLAEALRVAKPGSPIVLFTDWRQLPTTTDALQAGGWVWRGIAVWDKTEGARPSRGRFTSQAEYMVWGSAGPMPEERGVGCLPGVYRHFPNHRDKHHLTGKPTPLMREVVKICAPGGLILDPFAGSATTGVAALLEGFRFLGFERDAHYAAVSRERLADAARVAAGEKGRLLEFSAEGETPADSRQPSLFGGAE